MAPSTLCSCSQLSSARLGLVRLGSICSANENSFRFDLCCSLLWLLLFRFIAALNTFYSTIRERFLQTNLRFLFVAKVQTKAERRMIRFNRLLHLAQHIANSDKSDFDLKFSAHSPAAVGVLKI